jgi:rhodanese-related sulfurtransferase
MDGSYYSRIENRSLNVDHAGTTRGPTVTDEQRASARGGGAMTETLASMIAAARRVAREVAPAQACEALKSGAMHVIVDVREPQEFREGHVPDAVNIPRGLLEVRADAASPAPDPVLSAGRSERILVYCTKGPGARSLLAAQTLTSMGYENVEVLGGRLGRGRAPGRARAPARSDLTLTMTTKE